MIRDLVTLSRDSPLSTYDSARSWAMNFFGNTQQKNEVDQAIWGGFNVQQFSFAFLAGYQAALSKMFPGIASGKLKALCVSEENGAHPKAIETSLHNSKINGLKTYVTAGTEAEYLMVLCRTNEISNGRQMLKMVHLPVAMQQIQISDFELPFMREIRHGSVNLTETPIESDQILEGDGYKLYVKPFRTYEDIFLGISYQSMLLRQAIAYNWEETLRDKLILNIFTLKNLSYLAPSDPETVLLVQAAENNFEQLLPIIEAQISLHALPTFKADWETNKRLFSMGKKLKELRLSKSRSHIFG